MNDVNRMVAGALGVAVIGSIASSAYSSQMEGATSALPPAAAAAATDSVGAGMAVAARLPAELAQPLSSAAGSAFTDALGVALLVGAGALAVGALAVRRSMPDRRETVEPETDDAPVMAMHQTA